MLERSMVPLIGEGAEQLIYRKRLGDNDGDA